MSELLVEPGPIKVPASTVESEQSASPTNPKVEPALDAEPLDPTAAAESDESALHWNQGTLATRHPRISRHRHFATARPSGTYGAEREKCQPPSTSTATRLQLGTKSSKKMKWNFTTFEETSN